MPKGKAVFSGSPDASKPKTTETKTGKPITLGRQLENAFNLPTDKMAKLKGEFRSTAKKHLDPFATFTNQRPGTIETIEEELTATLPEFHDTTSRASRLQLGMRYIQYFFNDKMRRKVKKEIKEPASLAMPQSNNNTSDVTVENPDSTIEAGPPAAEPHITSNSESSSSSSSASKPPAAPMPMPKLDATYTYPTAEIKSFLESFTPSLLHLCQTFVNAGIVNQEALDALAAWPRAQIRAFLGELAIAAQGQGQGRGRGGEGEGKGKGEEGGKLGKVVVEAIILRFKANEYECEESRVCCGVPTHVDENCEQKLVLTYANSEFNFNCVSKSGCTSCTAGDAGAGDTRFLYFLHRLPIFHA
ncbi:hypothetical protein C8R45DRAFT_1072406 [Mycena sanguinolenta]|nr:hypothetical protein C8R45DRAFT_1072406 [Mycena sanguinolenta]